MGEKKLEKLIELNRQLVEETLILKKELIRIRSKMETNLYKIATKYNVINNDLLVVKNKYKGSVKCYKANNATSGHIKFE